ncbi:Putative deoxyribonuclease YcfH [Caenispirillum salinarum AK4]|uniref:Putative deoxyribonuclease YcfH n=1 Tax=Caenispirillum salinarum AK4 TaxID=1238182 RepID=K9GZV9_9PROT|nr:TatD family hydrolase [Caenispirillum salinarum]EKV31510.1 Putative deoxyribonuclease YcfH [Caenispirillum salinarum AK4]
MLVDSHCHLDFPDFAEDFEGVLARAREAGVGHMLTICTHITKFGKVLALAEAHEQMTCTVGIHPHEAGNEPETDAATLLEKARHPKVVGFGETGLDFFYDHSPREEQKRSFRSHIQAARDMQLPIVIHTRNADDETSAILEEEVGKGAFPGLIHCFSSGPELAEKAVELGLYISLSGILTFKKSGELREIAARVPLDRLLVETDAPYLSPVPKRGKRNEPSFVAHTAKVLAEVKGVSMKEVEETTTANFFRLFSKAPNPEAIAA